MKTLSVCCFFILLITHNVLTNELDSSQSAADSIKKEFWENAEQIEKQLDDVVEVQCRTKIGGKAAFKKFVQSREELVTCLKNVASENMELPSQVCNEKRPFIRSCLDAAVPGLTRCFDEDEAWFIKDFAFGSFNSIFDYVCEDIFTSLKEIMSLEGFDCMTNMMKNEAAFDNSTEKCLLSVFNPLDNENDSLSKPLVCNAFKTVKACVSRSIREQCPTNNGLLHIHQGFMDAILKNCS